MASVRHPSSRPRAMAVQVETLVPDWLMPTKSTWSQGMESVQSGFS